MKIEACEYMGSHEYGGFVIEQSHCDVRKIYAIKELCLLFVFLLSVRLFNYARSDFWHLSAKILYTVEPKTATSPCVHFKVSASPTKKKHHFSMYPF